MIYLDHNATTHLHPSVYSKMQELTLYDPMNPSSVHSLGRRGKSLIEDARKSIARLLGFEDQFKAYQITFTASGTEANNLILSNFKDSEIFISATEHPSIWIHSEKSSNVTIIKVDKNGLLDLEHLRDKLQNSKAEKKLLAVMLANNETGIIQPVKQIAEIAHGYGALVHSDCVQAVGKIDINMIALDADFISISAHKFGGPMGAGALVGKTSIGLKAQIIGGGQERRLRAGTENVPAIVGFGQAASFAKIELEARKSHMKKLRNKLEAALLASDHNIEIAGINTERLPNTSLIINLDRRAELQLIALDLKGVSVSSGSACSSGKTTPSHVLASMGYSETQMQSAIRISVGVTTTEQDIDAFLKIYNEINE